MIVPQTAAQPAARSGAAPQRVYLTAGLLTAALAGVGFWRTYFGPLVSGAVRAPLVIHIHVAVFVIWLVLFIAQVTFAATGRLKLHMRLGRWIMVYGVVVIGAGLMAAAEGFAARLATGDVFRAQRWLFGVLRDLVFFAPFLAAGWIYRGRPGIHKRLMIVATTILVLPAVSRMTVLGTPVPLWKFMLVWPVPVYFLMIHDFRTRRLVHPVYVIGVVAMVTMRLMLPLGSSRAWQAMAGVITPFFAR
jgi:hypothetical protein